ncbi:MAG: hypothetical protein H6555_09610 [Lewinellaceae bacterium]|nr:hypothetical protein [Lewinellaceae bacterium]
MKNRYLLSLFALLLFWGFAQGQITNATIYDFRDGQLITAGQSSDGLLSLAGTFGHHGATYGLNMKVGGQIILKVTGSATVRFLGSKHSGLQMVGTTGEGGSLGTQNTKVVTDLSDTYDFVYSGEATTLTFTLTAGTGNDLYLPTITVIPAQAGGQATTAEKNVVYYFDLRDGSIIPTNTNGQTGITQGLMEVVVGPSNAYGYNGTQHGSILKGGNKIKLQVAGNAHIKVGGSIYSNGTISVSSATGVFDKPSQPSATATNFDNGRASVDFLYVGAAGTVTLDFTGTNYIPYVEVVPVPYEVSLTPWVQKSGTIVINTDTITVTSGADASSNATIAVSAGTVISATNEYAVVEINLDGKTLAAYSPVVAGDIDSVRISNDSMFVVFKDPASDPQGYLLLVKDNSVVVEAEAGKIYTYNFANGSELPQVSYQALRYKKYVSKDGILSIFSNTDNESGQFGYHDAAHGGVFFPGNSFNISVAGDAIVTFIVDTYGVATDAVFSFSDPNGQVVGSIAAENIGGADGFPSSFAYKGPKGVITATLKSANFPTAEVYLHGLNVENAAEVLASNGKTDVWDFGAEQLDTAAYNNQLNVETINSWYSPSITVGSTGNVLPNFNAGVLFWTGGTNDRLRSTNTNLTRYDNNIASVTGYTGRIYVNSGANTGRFLSITLSEDDEVTLITKTDAGGVINFQYVDDPSAQQDVVPITSALTELKFVAKARGTYHFFDTQGKPSYYRLYRKDATYVALTGAVDLTNAADIPTDFSLVFTNEAGKSWSTNVAGGGYQISLPQGYAYSLSLAGANGYIISQGDSLNLTEGVTTHDVALAKVSLFTASGTIIGLGNAIDQLALIYTPDPSAETIFVPEPVIDRENSMYSVLLEPGVAYTISAQGVNDYFIIAPQLTLADRDTTINIEFSAKPIYDIDISAPGLNAEQLGSLQLTFSNLQETGYSYTFNGVDSIALRDGVYQVNASGLDAFPVALGLTSNLQVAGAAAAKVLDFQRVTNWAFDDKVIANGDPAYKGLLFSGTVSNEIAKGHLVTKADATIRVPVNPGEKVDVTYYYTADFSIAGGATVSTNTQSTSTLEQVSYVYSGDTASYVTILIGAGTATTYFTNIAVGQVVPYTPTLTVGVDKDFQLINDALAAVRRMDRGDQDRVTILIDPGNYEEMLVIDRPNITLKNAAANPNINLLNKGVDIAPGVVRITSYYGHGYSYFSMGNDQKWNADILRVNKENGYLSYENKGAGTTNGSYWNATVKVASDGFEAKDIIFENSFNQYISRKEAADVVMMWAVGGKGIRPTDYGNTAVQDRSYVERAAAIAILNNVQKVVLNKCRVIGRQDSFFGGVGSRVVVYKGSVMGAVDYLFGGMTAVFYKTDLAMNTSDVSSDQAYITAAQQGGGRGYLMYECNVTTAIPGTETAATYRAKPGYFGRPWQATTSEVVFYKTNVETSDYPGSEGASLIVPLGWQNSLGGESSMMYEYGTVEQSGANNSSSRASWSTLLTEPTLTDGTPITTFNFTKGNDNWDPIPELISGDVTSTRRLLPETSVNIYAYDNQVYIDQVKSRTEIQVYGLNGVLHRSFYTYTDTNFNLETGMWIVTVNANDGQKSKKLFVH